MGQGAIAARSCMHQKQPQKIAAFGSSYRERFGNAVG
jgi:hypothetical protein